MVNDLLFLLQILVVTGMCLVCQSLGLAALVSWLCLQSVLANILVLKMVMIFGLDVTVADAFMIGSLFCLNLIREYHGREACQSAILASLVCLLFTLLLFWIHLLFIPSSSDQMSSHYHVILSSVLPIMTVSGCVFTLVQIMDYYLFGYLKHSMQHVGLAWRVMISLTTTQVFDTALFTYWALGGWISSYLSVFFWSYALKVLITLFLSFSSLVRMPSDSFIRRFSRYVQV